MKMKTVYEANPALGDPMSIQVPGTGVKTIDRGKGQKTVYEPSGTPCPYR
jgi:hypothetical protein